MSTDETKVSKNLRDIELDRGREDRFKGFTSPRDRTGGHWSRQVEEGCLAICSKGGKWRRAKRFIGLPVRALTSSSSRDTKWDPLFHRWRLAGEKHLRLGYEFGYVSEGRSIARSVPRQGSVCFQLFIGMLSGPHESEVRESVCTVFCISILQFPILQGFYVFKKTPQFPIIFWLIKQLDVNPSLYAT